MSYIQMNRGNFLKLKMIRERPTAFLLLNLIADRAKRSLDHPDKSLEVGEAMIGDYESYGATEQIYKTDKEYLKINDQITTRVTNRGTIAKLISTEIFNINEEQLTNKNLKKQRATNEQLTTNNNDNNVKKKEKNTTTEQAKNYLQRWNEVFSTAYVSTKAIEGNLAYWLDSYKLEEILEAVGGIKRDKFWKDKDLSPEWLLRQKDKGEPVDRIGRMRENLKQDFSLGINFNSLNKK